MDDVKKCCCELYYSDSAIRERCLKMVYDWANAHPDVVYNNSPDVVADACFDYIKNGLIVPGK